MSFWFSPSNVLARRTARANEPQKPDVKHRTDIVNCTSCKHLVTCDMLKKSFDFKCNKYEMPKELSKGDYLGMLEIDFDKVAEVKQAEVESMDIINQLINQAIKDQDAGIQSDFTLEDEDLPTAKNFVDFYYNPRFAGEIKPMAKQIEICSDLFTEICFNPKCTDVDYAQCMPTEATYDDILEKVTFLEHGVCPKCAQTRFDMWAKYNRRKASTMVLCAGQRSGKDYTTGLALAYQDHRYLKLRDPAKSLNLVSGTMLYQTFTGIDFSQARKATFLPYLDFIEKSRWFQDYHAMLDNVGAKKGKKLYDIGKEAITWNYHGLASLVSSPDVRALRGVARRSYSITEIAYFYTKTKSAVRLDAEGIIEALQNSTAGVIAGFNRCTEQGKMDVPAPLAMIASSPRSVKDHVMQMLKLSNKDDSIVARHYCLAGNTLVPTNRGILRLDELHTDFSKTKKQNLKIGSYNENVKVTHSHYTGKKQAIKITSEYGHELSCSKSHQILVLRNNEHVWIKSSKLKIDDYMCINKKQAYRENNLKLDSEYTMLNKMKEGMAFCIGALVAEGFYTSGVKSGNSTVIYNNNKEWLQKIETLMYESLGIRGKIVLHNKKGNITTHNNKKIVSKKDVYKLIYFSNKLTNLWTYLGLSNTRTVNKKGSWFKVIPWSILQADIKSQIAFTAAYIEADGWIDNKSQRIGIASRSETLLSHFIIMLSSHGINMQKNKKENISIRTLTANDAVKLYNNIEPYLTTKKKNHFVTSYSHEGFPVEYLRDFIKSRRLPRKGSNVTRCLNDNGEVVYLNASKGVNCWIRRTIINGKSKRLTYDNWDKGIYENFLLELKNISLIEYKKLIKAVSHRYTYVKVKKIQNIGLTRMYDLTVNSKTHPAFIANGLIVHNSTFEFNPNIKPDDLKSFKAKNPILYKTSILAIPQNAISAFIPDRRLILNCMDDERPNAIRGKQITIKTPVGAKLMSADIQILVKGVDRLSPKVLSLDAGYNRNSFAFTLAHTVIDTDDKTGVETRFTVVDAVFEVIPTHSKPASYPDIYEQILVPVCEELNVQLVVTDRYPGAIHMLQSFDKELGIQGTIRSAKYADFLYFRQCLLNATVDIPKMECDYKKAQELSQNNYPHSFEKYPVAHMLMQAITVEDQMGSKVDKGEGFTDDIFYSMVLAHAVCNDEELANEFLGEAIEQSKAEEVIGYRQGFDGNSASIEVRGGAVQAKNNTVDLGVYVSYSG